MRRFLPLAAVSACLLASPILALAAETTANAPTAATIEKVVPPQSEAAIEAARVERLQRAELTARMDAVIEASNKTLAGLQKLIDAAPNSSTALDLERRMAQVKFDTTLDLLRVQSKFARENGRTAQADAIDVEIEEILHPKPSAIAPNSPNAVRTITAPAGGAQ